MLFQVIFLFYLKFFFHSLFIYLNSFILTLFFLLSLFFLFSFLFLLPAVPPPITRTSFVATGNRKFLIKFSRISSSRIASGRTFLSTGVCFFCSTYEPNAPGNIFSTNALALCFRLYYNPEISVLLFDSRRFERQGKPILFSSFLNNIR